MGRRALIGLLVAAAAALVLVGRAGALADWHTVEVTPSGPSPRTVQVFQRVSAIGWIDKGAGARGIVFLDGSCRAPMSTRTRLFSPTCVTAKVGRHPYRVVGLSGAAARGVVVVRPLR